MLKLVLVRHAQAETNLVHAVGRNNDAALTEKGREQARKLGQHWREHGVGFDLVFASAAVRATDTAKISCEEAGIKTNIVIVPEIVEIHRGAWEGKPAHTVFKAETLEAYLEDPWHFRAPEGESEREVEERMHTFFENTVMPHYRQFCEEEEERRAKEKEMELTSEGQHKGERLKQTRELRVAIFSHGCSLRCFLRRVLDTDSRGFRFELSNTATCELLLVGSRWTVRTLNSTSHLH